MARFAVFTLLGLSTLCAIGCINEASAQSSPLIDVNALVQILNTIRTSGGEGGRSGESSGTPSLLNIDVLVQLLNGLLAGGNSGTLDTSTLTEISNRASVSPPSSSRNNTDSLIAIRILTQLLNTIANTNNANSGGGGGGSLIRVNALISVLNALAGSSSSSGGSTRPLIGIDIILQALNAHRTARILGGRRYCHIGQLNQLLQSEATNESRNSTRGSVLETEDILLILDRVTYPPRISSGRNNSLIRVNILIDILNQLLGGSRDSRGTQTGNDALISIDVFASLLNNSSKNGGGVVGLVLNLVRGLLGPGGIGSLLNNLLGGILGRNSGLLQL